MEVFAKVLSAKIISKDNLTDLSRSSRRIATINSRMHRGVLGNFNNSPRPSYNAAGRFTPAIKHFTIPSNKKLSTISPSGSITGEIRLDRSLLNGLGCGNQGTNPRFNPGFCATEPTISLVPS